jgi:2-keto-3-deoxy-L-rhamnonate aldolase RhmA
MVTGRESPLAADGRIDVRRETLRETFKQALQSSKPLIGTLLTTASPEIAEALALIGFDWVFIDGEHGSLSIHDAQVAIQAIAGRCHTLLRVPDATPENIKRALDTGCSGLIAPLVNSAEAARAIVSMSRYPPLGTRSVGPGRAQGYGLRFAEYFQVANEEVAVVIQVEHKDAVRELESMLAAPGIDAVFVGPYDLSGSMGLLGQVGHPDVVAAVNTVRSACLRAKMPYATLCGNAEQARQEIEAGASFLAVGTDILHLANSARATLEALRR